MKLQAKDIYLDTLSREDCKTLINDYEYDFDNPAEELRLGQSDEKADEWFDEIQKLQGEKNVRLGIFLNDKRVIGDAALQDIDRANRKCSVGMGIAKLCNRSRGYGYQALKLMLKYGFEYLGMERIYANTLEMNIGAQRLLEKCGFKLEGRERESVYLNGQKYDRLNYAVLRHEYFKK
jgi:RimJ/RimL family protein N-acetyltransferase